MLIGFVTVMLYFALGQRVSLLAIGTVNITSDVNGEIEVGVIYDGQTVPILSCEDTKQYIVPKVRLENGIEGYVVRGDFKINREPSWRTTPFPISFSCG